MRISSTVRRAVAAGAVLGFLAAVTPVASGIAGATPQNGNDRNGTYLALGDSVAFGYVPPQAVPAPDYSHASNFVSYANYVAADLGERVANASCPGETTASFLDPSAQSNGCENSVGSPVGYRTDFPLHVQYSGSQIAYAVKYLTDHANRTNLVTIDIGANDGFVCQQLENGCTSSGALSGLASQISTNLSSIYGQIRATGYRGPLVALSYYSLSYSDPAQVQVAEFLNSIIAGVTNAFGGIVADGFTAFETPSAAFGGDPCAAGLLIRLPDGSCNIHPSQRGHELLAQAIEQALTAAGD
jgi:lysophospholipase L1-like esterase